MSRRAAGISPDIGPLETYIPVDGGFLEQPDTVHAAVTELLATTV